MSLFKGNEKTEVKQWIVEMEHLVAELNRSNAPAPLIAEQEDTLSWLRDLLASD